MDEVGKNAWCREHGVYPQQLETWRQAATQALAEPGEATGNAGQARRRIRELVRELRRKDKALAETTALLVLSKNSRRSSPRTRPPDRPGRSPDGRQSHRDRPCPAGARLRLACETDGISVRSFERWKSGRGLATGARRPLAERPMPAHVLTDEERARILAVANAPRFADCPPVRIVPVFTAPSVMWPGATACRRGQGDPGGASPALPRHPRAKPNALVAPHAQLDACWCGDPQPGTRLRTTQST